MFFFSFYFPDFLAYMWTLCIEGEDAAPLLSPWWRDNYSALLITDPASRGRKSQWFYSWDKRNNSPPNPWMNIYLKARAGDGLNTADCFNYCSMTFLWVLDPDSLSKMAVLCEKITFKLSKRGGRRPKTSYRYTSTEGGRSPEPFGKQ